MKEKKSAENVLYCHAACRGSPTSRVFRSGSELRLVPRFPWPSGGTMGTSRNRLYKMEKHLTIGDFWVTFCLCFKASPSAKPFIWKLVLFTCKWTKICVWIKLISIWNASHLDSLWPAMHYFVFSMILQFLTSSQILQPGLSHIPLNYSKKYGSFSHLNEHCWPSYTASY